MIASPAVTAARTEVLRTALDVLCLRYDDCTSPGQEKAACGALALAARDLARAVDGLPADAQPKGWAS